MENFSTSYFTLSGNESNNSYYYYYDYFDYFEDDVINLVTKCHVKAGRLDWLGVKIFILVTALPANGALMWTLLSRWGTMTPSELLGVNVSVLNVLYCLSLPLDIYIALHQSSNTTHSVHEALFSLNIFGCPLLLTFMCVERYVATAWPITYIILQRRKHRVVLCAGAWTLTFIVALLEYFLSGSIMALCLSIVISVLFLVMLLCLLGIMAALCHKGPADGSGLSVPPKRRALKNILAVMVPSVVAYSPLVALIPYVSAIIQPRGIQSAQCTVLHLLLLFPNFGLFIGPTFYLSRVTQVTCYREDQQTTNSRTRAE